MKLIARICIYIIILVILYIIVIGYESQINTVLNFNLSQNMVVKKFPVLFDDSLRKGNNVKDRYVFRAI